MLIQAYRGIATSYALPKTQLASPNTATEKTTDTVTLSQTAKNLAKNNAAGADNTTKTSDNARFANARNARLSDIAHANPSSAEELAHSFAYLPDEILYDANSIDAPPLRFYGSGEIATPEKITSFNQTAAVVRLGRIALYETEKARGTPAAEIMDKILAYNEAQPDEYKQCMAG